MSDEYDYYTIQEADNMTPSDSVINVPKFKQERLEDAVSFLKYWDARRAKLTVGLCEVLECHNQRTEGDSCGEHYREPLFRWDEGKQDWIKQI